MRPSLLILVVTVLTWWTSALADERPAPIPTSPVAMIGDSITRQGAWTDVLGRPDVTNWGIPGYTTGQLAWTFKDLVRQQPGLKVVFLSGGTNDLLLGVPAERIYENQIQAVAYWRERGVIPVLQAVIHQRGEPETNATIKALNARLRSYAKTADVHFLDPNSVLSVNDELRADLTTDGTHLKPEAYPLWAGQVLAILKQLGY